VICLSFLGKEGNGSLVGNGREEEVNDRGEGVAIATIDEEGNDEEANEEGENESNVS